MLPRKMFATEQELNAMYGELRSMSKVAKRLGVSKKLVLTYMKKYGIARRECKRSVDMDELTKLSEGGMTASEIAGRFGVTSCYINQLARASGIRIKDSRHPGFITTHSGYIMVKMPAHPDADCKGYVRQHRVVMEQILGRSLGSDEVVHHINGDKSNNSPENLQLMTHKAHVAHHHKGKQWWGVNSKNHEDIV